MSMIAAHRLGVPTITLDEDPDSPAAQVGPSYQGSIHDVGAIANLMRQCDFITFENEFILADTLLAACKSADFNPDNVVPGIETLRTIQDKLSQREAYFSNHVASPKAVTAENGTELGFPHVLKARFGGYDGKGTLYAKTEADYENARPVWENGGWLSEEFVSFTRELAVMVVSDSSGSYDTFPVVETVQKNHVCDLVFPIHDSEIIDRAKAVAISAVKALNGKGLFGVELFQHIDGEISVNEMAPRPHNTGHYTLDWGGTSQFEAHILSVLGEFSKVQSGIDTCMANILGVENAKNYDNGLSALMSYPEARMHWYGKRVSKPGRKMGHINVVGGDRLADRANLAREAFLKGWSQ
jgi:5-(carboxyamino)imidazole ribonucleotide synthase